MKNLQEISSLQFTKDENIVIDNLLNKLKNNNQANYFRF